MDRIFPAFLRTGSGHSATEQREVGSCWDQVPDVRFACSVASLIPLALASLMPLEPVPFFSCEVFDFVSCMVCRLAGCASLRDSALRLILVKAEVAQNLRFGFVPFLLFLSLIRRCSPAHIEEREGSIFIAWLFR